MKGLELGIMKNLHKVLCIVTIITACLFFAPLTHAGWADFLKKVQGGTKDS
jgi:hypothetical protein